MYATTTEPVSQHSQATTAEHTGHHLGEPEPHAMQGRGAPAHSNQRKPTQR